MNARICLHICRATQPPCSAFPSHFWARVGSTVFWAKFGLVYPGSRPEQWIAFILFCWNSFLPVFLTCGLQNFWYWFVFVFLDLFRLFLQIWRKINLWSTRMPRYFMVVTSGLSDQWPHPPFTPQQCTPTSHPTTPYHLLPAPYLLSLETSHMTSHPNTLLPSRSDNSTYRPSKTTLSPRVAISTGVEMVIAVHTRTLNTCKTDKHALGWHGRGVPTPPVFVNEGRKEWSRQVHNFECCRLFFSFRKFPHGLTAAWYCRRWKN